MNEKPLISIIIPAYNAEQWIEWACTSVLEQTYTNRELIVIDDGSTDHTYEIALVIADKHPAMKVVHTENGGVCKARNTGLDVAKGEYVAFLDADDLLAPKALEILYEAMDAHHADISIGWKTNMATDGRDIGCPYKRESGILTGTEALEYSLRDHPSMYAVWGKLYKKSLVEDLRFVEGRRVHEDSFFVFQCLMKQPKVVLLDDIVLKYRLSENSASRTGFSDKFFDILFFAQQKRELIEKQYPEFLSLAENVWIKANMSLLNKLLKNQDPQYRQLEKNCIRAVRKGKIFFKAATPRDEKWFWIITHHMYDIYKFLYRSFKNIRR